MKFTKEDAVKELAAKYKPRYGEPAKWERTIGESVDHAMKLIGEDSEIELDDFVGRVTPFLETTAGFVLKETSDVAGGLNKQIEELKKQVKPEPDKETKPEGDSELLTRIKALEDALAASKKKNAVADKRKELVGKLKEKGVKEDWIELMLGKAVIAEDTDVEKEAGDYLEIFNKMFADSDNDTTPLKPKGEGSENRFKAVIEAAGAKKPSTTSC